MNHTLLLRNCFFWSCLVVTEGKEGMGTPPFIHTMLYQILCVILLFKEHNSSETKSGIIFASAGKKI